MPIPSRCRNPECRAHTAPPPGWSQPFGSYATIAHGTVKRYRCRLCGATASTQSESMHYAAKRRLPLSQIVDSLLEGASQREIARRYHTSPMAIHYAIMRIGRQALAAQTVLLSNLEPRSRVVFDGLRSFVTSQDYPCDLTALVDPQGETILAVSHGVFRRGGRMTRAQRRRVAAKRALWQIPIGTLRQSIALIWNEIWPCLDPSTATFSIVDTDRHHAYRRIADRLPGYRHFRRGDKVRHRTTSALAARTADNPLFAVNYVDRMIRHRLREHTRETIAFGRHSAMQLYRFWIFAWDQNTRRPWRAKCADCGVHAAQGSLDKTGLAVIEAINRTFFDRRIDLLGHRVPEHLFHAWTADAVTPPIRWRSGQKGTTVVCPRYSEKDLERAA